MGDDDETRIEYDDAAGEAAPLPSSRDGEGDGPAELEIPWERLSAGALRGVIEEFVTREGTEYGAHDVELETKVTEVRRQLERGEVVVLFHAKTATVNLVHARELRGRRA